MRKKNSPLQPKPSKRPRRIKEDAERDLRQSIQIILGREPSAEEMTQVARWLGEQCPPNAVRFSDVITAVELYLEPLGSRSAAEALAWAKTLWGEMAHAQRVPEECSVSPYQPCEIGFLRGTDFCRLARGVTWREAMATAKFVLTNITEYYASYCEI